MKYIAASFICLSFFWSEPSTGQTFNEFDADVLSRAAQQQQNVLILFEQEAVRKRTPFYFDVFEGFDDDRFIPVSRLVHVPDRDSLALSFGVKSIPAIIVLNPNGELTHKFAGAPRHHEELNEVLTKSLSADESYTAIKKLVNPSRYGNTDFMQVYFSTVLQAGEKVDTVWWDWWSNAGFKEKTNEDTWLTAALRLSGKSKDRLAGEVRERFSKYEKQISGEVLKSLFFDVYLRHTTGYFGDDEILDERLKEFEVLDYPYIDEFKTNVVLRRVASKSELKDLTAFLLSDEFKNMHSHAHHYVQILNRFARVEAAASEIVKARENLQKADLERLEPVKHLAVAVLLYREGKREEAAKYLQGIDFDEDFQKTAAELTVEILNDRLKTGRVAGS